MLLREGVNPDTKSPEGFSPLCIAAFWGYTDIMKLLLEKRCGHFMSENMCD